MTDQNKLVVTVGGVTMLAAGAYTIRGTASNSVRSKQACCNCRRCNNALPQEHTREGGLRAIMTDQNKLVATVGGVTTLALGAYTIREGARVIWSYVDRILGRPSLTNKRFFAWELSMV